MCVRAWISNIICDVYKTENVEKFFGFTNVVHRGLEIEVDIDDEVQDADKIPCDFCSKKLMRKHHRKCVHLLKNVYVNNTDSATTGGFSFPELDEQLLEKDVMNTLNSVINKVR